MKTDPPALPSPPRPLRLLDREQAILQFNRRVLAQALRGDVPLLERLRYVTIVSSNVDEFFEVRVADVLEAVRRPDSAYGRTELRAMTQAAHQLVDEQYAVFNDQVMPALAAQGIVVLNHAQRDAAQRDWVTRFFEQQVRPLLVPVSLDPAHPFPQVANKSLNFIVRLAGADAFGRENAVAIVKVPRALPRVIRLPDRLAGGRQAFVLLTSVIRAHLGELFPGREVAAFSQFRVTRDSDLEVDGDDVTNLRTALRAGLSTRHFGRAIRLEVVNTCPPELATFMLEQFVLPAEALYRVNGPVNLVRLTELIDLADAPGLRFAPMEPAWPADELPRDMPVFERLKRGDLLLHHPYQSFEPVVQFLREAVHDPDVLAIRQTIYRTGAKSVMMDLLLEAARRGKEVLAVVELKARFDEEANINWAEQLEAVGAQVVYGIVGLKTHAKMLLVTRREGGQLRRYVHLSTGNYNPRTARLYTDLGYFSADPGLTREADALFLQLAGQVRLGRQAHLVSAPFRLHKHMLAHLAQVAQAARRGAPARVVCKFNALTDPALIQALAGCARAGAQVDLLVRGACMLPPDAPGTAGRLRVRSVIGRFLEHTRVLYFAWGDAADEQVLYLSSADWMSRNMFGRIELAWPVRNPALRQRIIDEALVPYLRDGVDAWALQADGSYRSLAVAGGHSAQRCLAQRFA